MHKVFNNVNDAFYNLVGSISSGQIETKKKPSRVGEILQVEEPVTITYIRPRERVLFNKERDCNPFFHLYESLWMLAGRNDVVPLDYYTSKIKDMASDDGETFNGAYGYRWRHGLSEAKPDGMTENVDQIKVLIDHLRANPNSRRAVLQMWNVQDDLLRIDSVKCKHCEGTGWKPAGNIPDVKCLQCDSTGYEIKASKDVCCNTCIYFSLRSISNIGEVSCGGQGLEHIPEFALDMTVCNRSNDLVLGMLGANVVHMSILQEYMAAHIGVEVGRYHHFTNNLHAYTNNWKPLKWARSAADGPCYDQSIKPFPLVSDPVIFDKELLHIVDENYEGKDFERRWMEPFFDRVAQPMFSAFMHHKSKEYDLAQNHINGMADCDWKVACINWMKKRGLRWT